MQSGSILGRDNKNQVGCAAPRHYDSDGKTPPPNDPGQPATTIAVQDLRQGTAAIFRRLVSLRDSLAQTQSENCEAPVRMGVNGALQDANQNVEWSAKVLCEIGAYLGIDV